MGVKERRQRERSETREKILDAARELFLSEGYDGVSMRKVADKIEYSPTAIYVHFADKQELFHELCQEDFGRLAEVFQGSAMSPDPIERLKQIGRTYINFGLQYPNHYKLMFMTPHPMHGPTEEDEEIKGNPEVDAYAFLKVTVQEALDRGLFRQGLNDADLLSQTLWAAVHGVIALHIAKGCDHWVDWRSIEQRSELTLDAILRGLTQEVQ